MTNYSDAVSKKSAEQYQLLAARLGKRIREEMNRKDMDQSHLAEKIGQSQAAVSNMINGKTNVSMKTIFLAMEALEMEPLKELERCSRTVSPESVKGSGLLGEQIGNMSKDFLSDPENSEFNGQLGEFHIYFHSTNTHEDRILCGTLRLHPIDGECLAELELIYNEDEPDPDKGRKLYTGAAFISPPQQAVYVLLMNSELAEMCFLVYPYKRILSSSASLECTMAIAATISSGIDSRLPTAHRVFLSRRPLTPSAVEMVRGQLLLNKSIIRISKESFEEIKANKELSPEFIEYIEANCTPTPYYIIDDSQLKSIPPNRASSYFHDICILRRHSAAPKNNKINPQVIGRLFREVINKMT